MLFLELSVIFIVIPPVISFLVPTRHVHIDLLAEHNYLVSHIGNKIGLSINLSDLQSCIYTCHNHDFCRTAVFDSQLLRCSLFEECSTRGQTQPSLHCTVISFLVCNGEPENMAFIQSLMTPISVDTVMSNLKWVKDLTLPQCYYSFFVNEYIYVPVNNVINVYETDTYTLVRTINIPSTSGIFFIRGDSQGTFIYFQNGDSNLYIYSLSTNIVTSTSSFWTNFVFCYSTSFIVVTAWPWNVADVYLRTSGNNSATYIYRIDNWNQLIHCAIINDRQLIGATLSGGLQTTILNKTIYNSTIFTIPLNTTYLPTGAMVSLDAAGRLYSAPTSSQNASTVFLPDGRLIGLRRGISGTVGVGSKYKFMFMTTDGYKISIFEYIP